MKKLLCVVLVAVTLMATLLVGCGQVTGECESCGKDARLYKVEAKVAEAPRTTDILCKNCADDIEKAYEMAKEMGIDATISVKEYSGK